MWSEVKINAEEGVQKVEEVASEDKVESVVEANDEEKCDLAAKKDAGRDFMAEKMARKVAEMPDVDPELDLAALRAKAKAGAAGKTDEEKKALGLLYDKSAAAGVREDSDEDEDDEGACDMEDPFADF